MKGLAGGGSGRRLFSGHPPAPTGGRRDRDEDLSLFREMQRSEKDCTVSLLQPVSDEFEPTGNLALYRIASAKKILPGFELLGESSKNDFDWLKTPPATPLFPSLEMETSRAPELAVQREIPILQPLSRFASNSRGSIATNSKPKATARSIAPRSRPMSNLPSEAKNPSRGMQHLNLKTATPLPIDSSNNRRLNSNPTSNNIAKAKNNEKEGVVGLVAMNLSNNNNAEANDRKTKPTGRGVSFLVRSTIPSVMPDISDQAPPNLRTDSSLSASRGRPNVYPAITNNAAAKKPAEPVLNPRRHSISQSVDRGRTAEQKLENEKGNAAIMQRGRIQSAGNGAHILGSKMLDKVMNARKSGGNNGQEKEQTMKLRSRGPNMNDSFGRIIPKTSSDTMAMKHSECQKSCNLEIISNQLQEIKLYD